jgi:hypothetical protein
MERRSGSPNMVGARKIERVLHEINCMEITLFAFKLDYIILILLTNSNVFSVATHGYSTSQE